MNNGKHGKGTHSTLKWVLIVQLKIPQMPQKISAQKFKIFEKSSLWVSVVRDISGPSEGLKIRGCQYNLLGIICPLG
jgi:hypothetical protein